MQAETEAMNARITIEGLHWFNRWRLGNGSSESFVVPFATTRPVNIVTHGDTHFDYGQFGIHLAQQDVLTFLGDASKVINARFIDCRKASPSFRTSLSLQFSPASSRTLVIPPGVAHTFSGLEGVTTLNAYDLFLPPLTSLLQPTLGWTPEHDIINLPLEVDPASVEGVQPMGEPAANRVYHHLAALQRSILSTSELSHAETRQFTLDTGEHVHIMLQPAVHAAREASAFPVSGIPGVEFKRHGSVRTGEHSRIVPVMGPSPFYIVDHGAQPYSFDSFGIHLGQEDHLTFLGPSCQSIRLKLVDVRAGSATLHREEWHEFRPDPEMELTIPCGVAHALFDMAHIYTLNRPVFYLDDARTYEPGNDVIDWPLDDRPYPVLMPNETLASLGYLETLVEVQKQLTALAPAAETPKALLVTDEVSGRQVKVILTQAARSSPAP
ncbi:dTDP-4-dehydrorhamnose 3,5-epimerase family protein [Pseudomonas sp. S75]|uniref:dTDP-4-dehydrorhamnose 3,5-epimerase family protein n=1 Tax=unclassified Pseudomonas TaxID=196821 RepID=UPI0019055001|nr:MULTISPECIES: dTDP-4-dehydrorhamnose 3,5-epimerase family protein [unclassified Pseudomonas]MBJ9977035.1 dTDP-4-dehydrorhamnose 3,5-epimerase family protein [Pseudomonas sp. S30]MBK0153969.1 dTDP-4-dehydrorhamnose 3,5-epimerase family protein [Pseudomonas sp. S75]